MAELLKEEDFKLKSEEKAFDPDHRRIIRNNMLKYEMAVTIGRKRYLNYELARKRTAGIRYRAIMNLDKNLVDFESNFTKRGGKVIWALDEKEAVDAILEIVKRQYITLVVKGKSMATEEIGIGDILMKNGIESLETDLGEFLVQLAGEKPYHIITPVMHKSKEDIAQLLSEKFGISPKSTPEEITMFVRKHLREKFVKADVGITGANFLIADIGGVALTENEGNGMMTFSFPKIHIVVAGIEKIIPSIADLDVIWPVLASNGTGQTITAYNSVITGPRQADETDGPDEMYVILLDNNRTNVLAKPEQRKALMCIKCGACLNACPVYRTIGGHAYGSVYSGPIGAVLVPIMKGHEEYKHLSYASSLCGRCTEVCPVMIPLHKLLLYNRRDSVNEGFAPSSEKRIMKMYRRMMMKRSWLETTNTGVFRSIRNSVIKNRLGKVWGDRREFPEFARKSFNRQWKDKLKEQQRELEREQQREKELLREQQAKQVEPENHPEPENENTTD
ncbi:MAG: iron-sulfur cluster-binding protein [Bacteroidetes bacterium]|nr:iron-sulfur cluster-binding protein [Bacteroidota bacterium]MBU1720675.1 iron-sulfur cluster-binding protein [Bacteroidota bacterium]